MMALLPRAPWSTTVRPGVQRASSVRFPMPRRSMSVPVTAEMLIGIHCGGCSTRVADTTTASSKAANRRVMSDSSTGPAASSTPFIVTSPKPLRETVTVKRPAETPANSNRPLPSVCVRRGAPGPPRSVIVAPDSTPPDTSTTRPVTLPPSGSASAFAARAGEKHNSRAAAWRNNTRLTLIGGGPRRSRTGCGARSAVRELRRLAPRAATGTSTFAGAADAATDVATASPAGRSCRLAGARGASAGFSLRSWSAAEGCRRACSLVIRNR